MRDLDSLIAEIRSQVEILLRDDEAKRLYCFAQAARGLTGDFAELGVYQGGSALVICEAKGHKALHLFDTFEGHPEDDIEKSYTGLYKAKLEDAQRRLGKYRNVHFYKGIFPSSAQGIKNREFCFLHLDCDLHHTTLASLEFFYVRMRRGIILSHDYPNIPGVKKAFDDFFADKPESIIQIADRQCLILKLGGEG